MAVDEWLLEQVQEPTLRVYQWSGEWGTLGYFGKLDAAMEALPDLQWVRRWTGGGTVDHRNDWTYTLAVPRSEPLARTKAAESYRWIHQALAAALAGEGIVAAMSGGEMMTGNALCFANPVSQDLITANGEKLAGAGQRRTKAGLLHQGSVAAAVADAESTMRAHALACQLADEIREIGLNPDPKDLQGRIERRYQALRST